MRLPLIALLVALVAWTGHGQEASPETPLRDAPPAPSAEEQGRIVESAREFALRYTASLPNFICTETMRRYQSPKASQAWKTHDTLTLDLAFSEKGESYKLLTIDGKPTTKSLAKVGGAKSTGEFGSLLEMIFDPKTETQFHWERWTSLRGQAAHVVSYRVAADHSKYVMSFAHILKHARTVIGFHGLLYVNRESHQILRLTQVADGIPANWPVSGNESAMDYGVTGIAEQQSLLPMRVEFLVVMRDGARSRNVIEFSDYRKFSSQATINFEKQ